MKTSRAISNVTWNSVGHFKATADALVADGVLDWYHAIEHKAEADELKDHIHFVVKPSKAVDTAWLCMRFAEWVEGEEKPRKPTALWRPVASGHMGDWLLYSLHDKDYLASKLKKREYSYTLDDCITSDAQSLGIIYNEAKSDTVGLVGKIKKAFEMGISLDSFLLSGAIPLSLCRAASDMWSMLENRKFAEMEKVKYQEQKQQLDTKASEGEV